MSDKKDASSGGSDQGRKGSAENTDTGTKSVSELLQEWEQERSGSDGKPDKSNKDELTALKEKLEALESERIADRDEKEYSELMSQISGDLDVDESIVDGWLRKRAKGDKAIIKAFDNRDEKPAQYRELVKALQPEFAAWAKENIARPKDSGLTAAVRNARESSSEPAGFDGIKWGSLSDNEFAAKKQEVFRHAEKGGFK